MRHLIFFAVTVVFASLLSTDVFGQFIRPDSVVASSQFASGFDALAINTINGSGLPSGFSETDIHSPYASGNHWTTAAGTLPTDAWITWGFSTPRTLDAAFLWNHLSTSPPANNDGYDVTLFDLTLLDSSSSVLLTLNDVPLVPDNASAQVVPFGKSIANVSEVIFEVEAVQSSPDFTGLAEVGFSAIPEPSSLALVVLGGIGLGFRRHR